jgi:hypothetical protein
MASAMPSRRPPRAEPNPQSSQQQQRQQRQRRRLREEGGGGTEQRSWEDWEESDRRRKRSPVGRARWLLVPLFSRWRRSRVSGKCEGGTVETTTSLPFWCGVGINGKLPALTDLHSSSLSSHVLRASVQGTDGRTVVIGAWWSASFCSYLPL